MSVFRNLLTGLITALASILIVVGALSISMTEGFKIPMPSPIVESSSTPTLQVTAPVMLTESGVTALPSPTAQPTKKSTATPLAPTPTACPIPDGWEEYIIQPGDNLADLADQYGLSTARLMKANCLVTQSLLTGTVLYLPRIPTATARVIVPTIPVTCGVPYGWIPYTVQPGDTLFRLSLLYGVSVLELQSANCLNGTTIQVGQVLWVPNVATRTPAYSPTPVLTRTPTRTQVPPTPPPTATVPTPEHPNPTATAIPATATTAPSSTPVPTLTQTTAPTVGAAQTETGDATTPEVESTPATSTAPNS